MYLGPRASIWKNEKSCWEAVAAATKQYILLGAEGDEDHQQPAHQFVLLGAEGNEGGGSSGSGGVLKCSENPNLVSELLELRWWRCSRVL